MTNQSQGWLPDASYGSIAGGVHGGLVAGMLMSAAGGDIVRSATVHFLHRVIAGEPADIATQRDRDGSTRSTRAELSQRERLVAVAQVLSVPVTDGATALPAVTANRMVDNPGDGTLLEGMEQLVPFARHLEIRALGDPRPLAGGTEPRLEAWVRLRDTAQLPPLIQLAVLADALAPSSFAVLTEPMLLPTVELTLHLAGPLPGTGQWVRLDQWTSHASADVVVDDAVIRDECGRTVAAVRQSRRAFPPR